MQLEHHYSIEAIPESVWNALIPDQVEDWRYYLASERVLPEGFRCGYLSVRHEGRIVAVAPVFHTYHYLHVSLSGRMRRMADWVAAKAPFLVRMGLTGLGSAVVDRCHVGIDPSLTGADRVRALTALLDGVAESARTERTSLLVVKDADDTLAAELEEVAALRRFARIRSLPNVYLHLPHRTWDEYLKAQGRRYGTYIARKEKQASHVRMELVDDISDIADEIYQLFEQTRRQAIGDYGDFEKLHPRYFKTVAEACRKDARFLIGRIDGKLVSFLFFMQGKDEVVWNFIGMSYPEAREHNLYFVSLNHLVRHCIARRIPRLRMGNTSYAPKLVYGGRLATHWVYLRHRNPVMNWFFGKFSPAFDYVSNDTELNRLAAEKKIEPDVLAVERPKRAA